jgi:hypothetical protein
MEGKIRFLHAAAGFPTKETWLKAIKESPQRQSTDTSPNQMKQQKDT